MDRKALLNQVTVLDFMATDLQLYLNTHPQDRAALKMYNDTLSRAQAARRQYEQHFGPLVGARSASSPNRWNWSDTPWPWQADFNYELPRHPSHHATKPGNEPPFRPIGL